MSRTLVWHLWSFQSYLNPCDLDVYHITRAPPLRYYITRDPPLRYHITRAPPLRVVVVWGDCHNPISCSIEVFLYSPVCCPSGMSTLCVYVLCMYCVCTVYVLCMYCVCTVYVLCMYCVCTVYVLCMYCVCTVYVLCMYCVCTVYVLCMYCVCTVYGFPSTPRLITVSSPWRYLFQIDRFLGPSYLSYHVCSSSMTTQVLQLNGWPVLNLESDQQKHVFCNEHEHSCNLWYGTKAHYLGYEFQ